jgi:hypothetical protein
MRNYDSFEEMGFNQIMQLTPGETHPGVTLMVGGDWKEGINEPLVALSFDLAARMVESRAAYCMSVLSLQPSLILCGVWMMGDPLATIHHWKFFRDMLETSTRQAWCENAEDFTGPGQSFVCANILNAIFAVKSDVLVLDFSSAMMSLGDSQKVDFSLLQNINKAAKDCGKVVFACVDLPNAQGSARPTDYTYSELAMRVALEYGVNLPECVERIVAYDFESSNKITILKMGQGNKYAWIGNRSPSEKRFEIL